MAIAARCSRGKQASQARDGRARERELRAMLARPELPAELDRSIAEAAVRASIARQRLVQVVRLVSIRRLVGHLSVDAMFAEIPIAESGR